MTTSQGLCPYCYSDQVSEAWDLPGAEVVCQACGSSFMVDDLADVSYQVEGHQVDGKPKTLIFRLECPIQDTVHGDELVQAIIDLVNLFEVRRQTGQAPTTRLDRMRDRLSREDC